MNRNQANVARSPARQRESGPQRYYVYHEFGGPAELTTTLVHALSDVTGADVTDTELSLADHVEPSALDSLFSPGPDGALRIDSQLRFVMWGYRVTVQTDGRITIVPPHASPPVHG